LHDVLNRPKIVKYHKLTPEQIDDVIDELIKASELVSEHHLGSAVSDDPDDDIFLAVALEGGADVVISGDSHLLVLKTFRDIPIISPADFVVRFLS